MSFLYVLQNEKSRYYVGITALPPEERLRRHNSGHVSSTKLGRPWRLIYKESFATLGEARVKEKQIKSWKGGNAFKKFVSTVAGSSNGRTSPFEGEYLGSSPGPAAKK